MNERVDDLGRWVQQADGTWLLVEPSEAFTAATPTAGRDDVTAPAELAAQARAAVSGFSTNSGTRQAVEKLADAVEALG